MSTKPNLTLRMIAGFTFVVSACQTSLAAPPRILFVQAIDGEKGRPLVTDTDYMVQGSPDWSPDGMKIVYDAGIDSFNNTHIFIVDAKGGKPTNLGPGNMPSFSPNGKRIAFSWARKGVTIMNVDGSNREVIVRHGWGAQWSPDGKMLAFGSQGNVMIHNLKTSEQRSLLKGQHAARYRSISWNSGWSPDGKRIGFKAVNRETGKYEIAVASVAGDDDFQVVWEGDKSPTGDISWHPDSKQVMFAAPDPMRRSSRLFVAKLGMQVETHALMLKPINRPMFDSDWSPDGKHVVFAAPAPKVVEGEGDRPARGKEVEPVEKIDKGAGQSKEDMDDETPFRSLTIDRRTEKKLAEISDQKLLERIDAAWKARSRRIDSAEFVWTKTVSLPRASVRSDPPTPARDLKADMRVTFKFDGAQRRWIHSAGKRLDYRLSGGDECILDETKTESFDGKAYRSLTRNEQYRLPLAVANAQDMTVEDTLPVLWACGALPATSFAAIDLKKHVVEDRDTDLDGTNCVVLKGDTSGTLGVMRYVWLDRDRDFVVRRYMHKQDDSGIICRQIDIEYEKDAKHGWLPSSWKQTVYTNPSSTVVRVTEHRINPMLVDMEFHLEFPIGSLIRDRHGKYHMQEKDKTRAVSLDEIGDVRKR